jgi:diaminohydroxyphosphoribosylaminopyrimidine deaminase/5-amino-6-(5-phosphoribosylamino)uracil reductase
MNHPTYFMQQAILQAELADYTVSPNPKVGCVIVKDNQIIARGYHKGPGQDHAEVDALKKIGVAAIGSDLYVTLEPCCHYGRTPPCTDAIIQAGIKRIFFSIVDPNPLVSGKGMACLQKAGIDIFVGLCEKEASTLNRFFIHFMKHKTPYVMAKWALSIDGKMTTVANDNRQISSAESQSHLHQQRNNSDAILVGVNTIIIDDPQLTTRYTQAEIIHHPLRIILDTRGRTPLSAKIFDPNSLGKTLIATTKLSNQAWRQSIQNAETCILPIKNNQVDLKSLVKLLGERGIMSLLVEGGRTVLESFFAEDLVQETQVYFAPQFIGSLEKKKVLVLEEEKSLGEDRFFRFTT